MADTETSISGIPNLATVEEVKLTAPDLLEGLSDDTINALIGDATLQVLADGFPAEVTSFEGIKIPIRELATRYLTCHLASMDSKANAEGIASEEVSVIKRSYRSGMGRDWLSSSIWGLMYLRLYKRYANPGTPRHAVIQH